MDKFNEFYENLELQCLSLQEVAELSYATGQQSRQVEVEQLQSQINEMAEVGLSQEGVIREKDKRIEEALAIVERFRDKRYPFNVFCNPMEKALRGEHE